jgi:F-box-like
MKSGRAREPRQEVYHLPEILTQPKQLHQGLSTDVQATPPMGHMPPPHLMQVKHHASHPPLPQHGGTHGLPHHPPPPYHHPMYMRGPPPGYPHMGMAITPAGYGHHSRHHMHGDSTPHAIYGPPPYHRLPYSAPRRPGIKRHAPMAAPQVTPTASTPRTPGVRVQFDPASSKKKRKISPGQEEASVPFFGIRYPPQPKTTSLTVFAFLSNDDLYNAGLVCKSWSQLAMDEELWKFD